MPQGLKHALAQYAPGPITAGAWSLRRALCPSAVQRFEQRIYDQLGGASEVLRGPFAGMKYSRMCYAGSTLNRTLGTYELELHPWIERLVAWNPDVVVDVGTSDGYYLVGLARRLPRARAVGFDTLALCRHLTGRLARMNGVEDRVQVRGLCTPGELRQVLSSAARPAVMCDCDTGELSVMNPAAAPALRTAAVLVEVHDNMRPGISEEMRRRFAPTHDITVIPVRPRTRGDLPPNLTVSTEDAAAIMQEYREPTNFWLYLSPKSQSPAGHRGTA